MVGEFDLELVVTDANIRVCSAAGMVDPSMDLPRVPVLGKVSSDTVNRRPGACAANFVYGMVFYMNSTRSAGLLPGWSPTPSRGFLGVPVSIMSDMESLRR